MLLNWNTWGVLADSVFLRLFDKNFIPGYRQHYACGTIGAIFFHFRITFSPEYCSSVVRHVSISL